METVQPIFLEGSAGRLFAVYYPPAVMREEGCNVLYVPPFAEEMNRARRMAALQARGLAALGFGVLLLDLFGTGESDGDFGDARWSIWLDDISAAADWLTRQGSRAVTLWGLRLGALLAAVSASQQRNKFQHLVLWQPVADGKTMLTQFLRLRVAAAMAERGEGETTDALRTELAAGHAIEIAGYELSPELAAAITAARLDTLALPAETRVDWFEVTARAGDPLSPAGRRVIDAWRAAGITASDAVVAGQPFWSVQETTVAPELLAATRRLFAGYRSP